LLDELFTDAALRVSLSVGWLGADRPVAKSSSSTSPWRMCAEYPSTPLESRNTRHDPAHILFTSGSTGHPKGVVVSHSSVIHFVEWARQYFHMDASDRTSGHSPLHFDLSTFDIFGTFAAGAELYLVPPDLNLLPHKLADFIRASELTQWFSVPSILNYLAKFDVVKPHDFPAPEAPLVVRRGIPTPASATG